MNQALFQAALKDTGCFPRFVSECELTNFERCLEINLDDPRDPSKIVYPLHVIGVIILTARVSGCNNCEEIRTYWEDHLDFFKKRLYDCPDEDYIPSAQTIRRVQTILDIDNLTQVYYEFFSKPAVAKAFDAFKDQQAFIENNAMPMPPELKSQVDSMVTLQWATLCQHFNEQKKKLEKEFEERLKEARSARDDALDNNELLKRTNQELSSRLQEASEKNNELHAANENFKEELNKKNFEIGMLQERVKAQETSIKDLKGAFDKIANK